jgi:hypothetical protein
VSMNNDHTFPSAGFGLHSRTPWILFFSIRAHLSCLIPNESEEVFQIQIEQGSHSPCLAAQVYLPPSAPVAHCLNLRRRPHGWAQTPRLHLRASSALAFPLPTAAKISPRWWLAVSTSDTSLGPMLPSHWRDRRLQPNPATCITLRTPAVTTWRGRIYRRREKGAAAALPCLLRRVRRPHIQLPCSHG